MKELNFELKAHIDRFDPEYKDLLSNLLSKEQLIEKSEVIKRNEPFYGQFKKRVSIKFAGLSGLSIIGGVDAYGKPKSKIVESFLGLISNHDDILKELNENGVYVDIKVLYAYPYSDFMYDIIQAENTEQDGFSMACILRDKKAPIDYRIPLKLTFKDLEKSITYQNLTSSLQKIQTAVNEGRQFFNNDQSPNRLVVKLTPLNILACLLKINYNLFIDPYVYSKEVYSSSNLALISPVSQITIPGLLSPSEADKLSTKERRILDHYCSLISHFRYIWQHPLTMYSTDATNYDKGVNNTLSKIKEPFEISYLSKALRIEKEILSKKRIVEKFEIDLWKQYCKNELIRYCSKYNSDQDPETISISSGKKTIKPIPIFIVGSWKKIDSSEFSDTSTYMNELKGFINKYFVGESCKGLKLNPIIVDAEDGEKIQDQIFQNLNLSQLGIVVQTNDYKDEKGTSRPNVYFERGYLMGRLSKRRSRLGQEKEMVFVFKEMNAFDGSDFSHITHTPFTSVEDFKIQFFRIVKWLWNMTELNSEYALSILFEYHNRIEMMFDTNANKEFLNRLYRLNEQYIEQIQRWQKDYQNRTTRLSEK
jgi:Predicted nucleotide-binding protein containing TIR-like domain